MKLNNIRLGVHLGLGSAVVLPLVEQSTAGAESLKHQAGELARAVGTFRTA